MTDGDQIVPDPGRAPRDPEELEAEGPARGDIDPATRMGAVHLTVSDLDRSLGYYGEAIGLRELEREDGRAAVGTGERPLLVLTEEAGAVPADGRTGLYHFAMLVPERDQLARWLAHAARDQVPMTGLSDHFVSEALYLRDPDGHGIEIYWDRPREVWEGQVMERMTTLPLNVQGLLGELDDPATEPFDGLPGGTVMGHVHLRVSEIASTVSFYRDLLGFGLMAQLGPQAAFLGAGGYHHHLGANIWESAGASPPDPGMAGLRRFTILFPGEDARAAAAGRLSDAGEEPQENPEGPTFRDPSGNVLTLAVT